MWFAYVQRAVSGQLFEPAALTIIEAPDALTADAIAAGKFIYLNGVEQAIDCPCCGDRFMRLGPFQEPSEALQAAGPLPYDPEVPTCLLVPSPANPSLP